MKATTIKNIGNILISFTFVVIILTIILFVISVILVLSEYINTYDFMIIVFALCGGSIILGLSFIIVGTALVRIADDKLLREIYLNI